MAVSLLFKDLGRIDFDKAWNIQKKLFEISNELVKEIKSRHIKMGDMLVPLSMAILTLYDEEYLGTSSKNKDDA